MIKTALTLLLIFVTTTAWAGGPNPRTIELKVNGKKTQFLDIPLKRMLISASCLNDLNTSRKLASDFNCDAARATRGGHIKKLTLTGGQNPGAVICQKLSGRVTYALDAKKNETTFCRFKDQSMISTGSLTYWRLLAR